MADKYASYDHLRHADSPEQFCAALEAIALRLQEEASELDFNWQDDDAGKPWRKVAKGIERVSRTFG